LCASSHAETPHAAATGLSGARFVGRRSEGIIAMTMILETATAGEGRRAPVSPAERASVPRSIDAPAVHCDAALVAVARRHLLADLREPPTVERLARRLGVGVRRLSAAFRIVLGRGVSDVVREARLEAARRAIETRDAPLKQIAWEVGYGDVTNFIHAFRNRFGAPPRRFQKTTPAPRRLAA